MHSLLLGWRLCHPGKGEFSSWIWNWGPLKDFGAFRARKAPCSSAGNEEKAGRVWGHGEKTKLVEGALMGKREDLQGAGGARAGAGRDDWPGRDDWDQEPVWGRDGKAKDFGDGQVPHSKPQPCPDPAGIPLSGMERRESGAAGTESWSFQSFF